tara:strand:+ start:1662 stop:2078 length:417 start_codon:yes stop_codon:yes gene_type:complete
MFRSFLIFGLALGLLGLFAVRYSQPTYSVRMSGHETTWVGNYAHLRISVIPEEGWKLSKEAPTKIVLKHTDNVKVSRDVLTVANAKWDKDETAHFDVIVTGTKAGLASIEADMNLFICNPKTCKREWFRMTKTIVVKP